ncbi:hypothetical protein BX666DRAFT_1882771 [Dichotomocladium elegans]|nr:hypothetical protein BX666DRAFT_1882771 [Dichotomocladium elegans]
MATSKRNNTSMRTSGKILKRAYRPVPRSRIPSIQSSTRVQGLTSTLRSLQLCKDTSDDVPSEGIMVIDTYPENATNSDHQEVVEAMSEDNFNDEEEGNVGNQRETAFSKYRFKLDESESDYSSESEADDDDSSCDSPTVNGRKQLHLARQSLLMQSFLPNGSPWVGQTVDSGAADMPHTTSNMERRNTCKKMGLTYPPRKSNESLTWLNFVELPTRLLLRWLEHRVRM